MDRGAWRATVHEVTKSQSATNTLLNTDESWDSTWLRLKAVSHSETASVNF